MADDEFGGEHECASKNNTKQLFFYHANANFDCIRYLYILIE